MYACLIDPSTFKTYNYTDRAARIKSLYMFVHFIPIMIFVYAAHCLRSWAHANYSVREFFLGLFFFMFSIARNCPPQKYILTVRECGNFIHSPSFRLYSRRSNAILAKCAFKRFCFCLLKELSLYFIWRAKVGIKIAS